MKTWPVLIAMSCLASIAAFVIGRADGAGRILRPFQETASPYHASLATWVLSDEHGTTSLLKDRFRCGAGTILYVTRAGCVWCERNKAAANALAAQLQGKYCVVGLLLDGEWPVPRTYVFPSFRFQPDRPGWQSLLTATPATIIIDHAGIVRTAISGAYIGPARERLKQMLGVTLPDVITPEKM